MLDELFLVHVIGDVAVRQILELVGILQVVDGDDVFLASLVQRLDQVGTNKPGCAGDYLVHIFSLGGKDEG
jgi:hypothetical protein